MKKCGAGCIHPVNRPPAIAVRVGTWPVWAPAGPVPARPRRNPRWPARRGGFQPDSGTSCRCRRVPGESARAHRIFRAKAQRRKAIYQGRVVRAQLDTTIKTWMRIWERNAAFTRQRNRRSTFLPSRCGGTAFLGGGVKLHPDFSPCVFFVSFREDLSIISSRRKNCI